MPLSRLEYSKTLASGRGPPLPLSSFSLRSQLPVSVEVDPVLGVPEVTEASWETPSPGSQLSHTRVLRPQKLWDNKDALFYKFCRGLLCYCYDSKNIIILKLFKRRRIIQVLANLYNPGNFTQV